ncbi:MAG: rhomboid family intrarane serine protease [Segetibacter sp.]|nr:rhomboid family intrarane serine protease [Segetibacter sp.]
MAFVGWKTEYEKRVPADGMTNWEIFSIAEQACKELEWEYLVVDEKTFTATTPTHWTLSEEIITIVVENEQIVFKSQSESLELYEAGRNQKNIEDQLLPAFKRIKLKWKEEDLHSKASALNAEIAGQLKSGNRVASEKMTFGFRDHEMTFTLMAVMVLVFIIMAAKGVNIVDPSVADIINWGGNIKFNITGGEWWRLLTANFVHIGVYPLIVNLFGLYFIGLLVESVLGNLKFLIGFLCAGVIANIVSIMWVAEGVTAGASGAIFGLYGILLAFTTTNYINKKFPKLWLVCIAAYLAFNVVIGLHDANDNAANIGGLVAGTAIGYLFYFFHFKRNLARAGGTRISVEVLLITGLLVFLYLRSNARDDSFEFEMAVMKVNQIEVKAMTQMQRLQEKTNEEASKFLRDTALPEWKHFQKEIMKTGSYSLDSKFKHKRKLLNQYAQLRVRQTELIYKAIAEDTGKYEAEINEVSEKIDKIIDQLGE